MSDDVSIRADSGAAFPMALSDGLSVAVTLLPQSRRGGTLSRARRCLTLALGVAVLAVASLLGPAPANADTTSTVGPTKYFSYWDWHSWVVLKDVENTANSYNNIHWDAPSADYEADETQNLSQLRYGSTGAYIAGNNCYLSTTGPNDYSGTCIKSWPRGTQINWQAWGSIRTCIAYAPTLGYDCYNLDADASGISKSGWVYG